MPLASTSSITMRGSQRDALNPTTSYGRAGGSSLAPNPPALKNRVSRTQQPVQPPLRSEVRYKRIESSCRLLSGNMVYEETEEFERITYPARSNPRTKRAVRFASSPTSIDFDLPTKSKTGPSSGPPAFSSSSITQSAAHQTGSRSKLYNRDSHPSAHQLTTPQINEFPYVPSASSSYQHFHRSYPPSRPDSRLPDVPRHLPARAGQKPPARPENHWDPPPAPYYLSAHHAIRRRPSATHIDHNDLMRAEAERLSSYLTHRPGPPLQSLRPTGDFFLFSSTSSIPGFQIVRELGPIQNRIMAVELAQGVVRSECEADEQMRSANAVVGFRCEHVDWTRRHVRVSGMAVEVCPGAPRVNLMHDFDQWV